MTTIYGPVTLDGIPHVFQGYYDPTVEWRGSLVPSFDRTEAEKVAACLNIEDKEGTLLEWQGNSLLYTHVSFPDSQAERIEPDENNLYAIGAHCGY